jgi:hypothetical protein
VFQRREYNLRVFGSRQIWNIASNQFESWILRTESLEIKWSQPTRFNGATMMRAMLLGKRENIFKLLIKIFTIIGS